MRPLASRYLCCIAALVFVIGCTAAVDASTLGYWRFEVATGGVIHDYSGNGNLGNLWNAPTFVPEVPINPVPGSEFANQYSLLFNAASEQAVIIPDAGSLHPLYRITVEAWVKPQSSAHMIVIGKQDVIWSHNSYQIEIHRPEGEGVTTFVLSDGDVQHIVMGPDIPNGEWTHLAGTWDGSTMRLYIDCEEVGSVDFEGPIHYVDEYPVLIGAEDDLPDGNPHCLWFDGLIDEVRISNVALCPACFLNYCGTVPVRDVTWGTIKAMYR